VTRGTTNPNRLRRVDRWLVGTQAARLRRAEDPLVVDLGYGRTPITTREMHDRLREVRADVEVIGVEIDRDRVDAAAPYAQAHLSFRRGGFNLPLDGRRPAVVRAMNVLRQYDERAAYDAWETLRHQLGHHGIVVEGTCDEIGRRAVWVAIDETGPRTVTFAARPDDLVSPGELAERLPKVLIHRNVAGERVHDFLRAWDRSWSRHGSLSPRHRWAASIETLAGESAYSIGRNPVRWRLGELTVAWRDVAPLSLP
jgi:hypothetical protein